MTKLQGAVASSLTCERRANPLERSLLGAGEIGSRKPKRHVLFERGENLIHSNALVLAPHAHCINPNMVHILTPVRWRDEAVGQGKIQDHVLVGLEPFVRMIAARNTAITGPQTCIFHNQSFAAAIRRQVVEANRHREHAKLEGLAWVKDRPNCDVRIQIGPSAGGYRGEHVRAVALHLGLNAQRLQLLDPLCLLLPAAA